MNSSTYTEFARATDAMGREIVGFSTVDPHDGDHAMAAVLYCEFAPPLSRYELWYLIMLDGQVSAGLCDHKQVPGSYPTLAPAMTGLSAIVADLEI